MIVGVGAQHGGVLFSPTVQDRRLVACAQPVDLRNEIERFATQALADLDGWV